MKIRSMEFDCFDKYMIDIDKGVKVKLLHSLVQSNWSLYRRLCTDFGSAKAALKSSFSSGLDIPVASLSYTSIVLYRHELHALRKTLYGAYSLYDAVVLLCSCIASKLELEASDMYIRLDKFSKYDFRLTLNRR